MAQVLKKCLFTPASWLTAAMMLFSISIALGYYKDQQVAVQALAKPRGPAPLVFVQDFDLNEHTNLAGEVRLIAEVDFGRVLGNDLEDPQKRGSASLIPLYRVSAVGQKAVSRESSGDKKVRPVLRVDRELGSAVPLGAIVSRFPRAVASNLDLDRFIAGRIGAGLYGTVVEVSGVMRSDLSLDTTFRPTTWQGAAAKDIVIVERFETERMLGLGAPDETRLILTRLGLVLLLIAALLAVRPQTALIVRDGTRRKPSKPRTVPEANLHCRFQPLATQDEIYEAEELEATRAADRRHHSGLILNVPFRSRR